MDALHPGGLEKSMLQIIKHLKCALPVVCHIYPHNYLGGEFEKAGIRTVSLDVEKRFDLITAWRRLLATLGDIKPDIIHLAGLFALLVGRAAGRYKGIPVIDGFTNEAYTSDHYAAIPSTSQWKLKVIQELDRLSGRWVTHFISNSHSIRRSYEKTLGIPSKKVAVIYRGRDPHPYINVNRDNIELLKNELRIGSDTPVLVNVARLIPRKGQSELICAFKTIKEKIGKAVLIIAGEGHFRADLEILASRIGVSESILLLGHRNDVPDLLHLADVFVFPSHYEGIPGALIEAMMAGCPVIASDIPVHREIINHEKNGLLVNLSDSQALAEQSVRIIQEKQFAKDIGKRAQKFALEKFNICRITELYETIYKTIWRLNLKRDIYDDIMRSQLS